MDEGKTIVFHSDNPDADNTLDNPDLIIPTEHEFHLENNKFNTQIGPLTFAICKVKLAASN